MVGTKALGKYRLLRLLGRGSNAEVFLAQPLHDPDKRVVVKRIHDHIVSDPKFRQMFDAEVRSMAKFTHPYSTRFLEAALDDPIGPCLVMEYVPGITLEDILTRQKRVPAERLGRLLGFLCHALQAAHAAGIVHRDLKPANLMISLAGTPDETLKVMDFGFAGFSAKPHIQLADLTGRGPVYAVGTPGYVSPEMIRGDTVDGRSDLYSVGVMLFELLTGRLPFHYDTEDKILDAHIKEQPPRFHRIGCSFVNIAVEGVIQLAMSKFPNERPQSPKALAESYGAAIGDKDLWKKTAPPDYESLHKTEVITMTPPPRKAVHDPFRVAFSFEVHLPERMAAVKIKGFVEDFSGMVLESDPGFIRLRLGVPNGYAQTSPKESSLFNWLRAVRKPFVEKGQEPIEVELQLEKPDPTTARLNVSVTLKPMADFPPKDRTLWQTRCERLKVILRQYLGG